MRAMRRSRKILKTRMTRPLLTLEPPLPFKRQSCGSPLVIAALGFGLDFLFERLRLRLTRWAPSQRDIEPVAARQPAADIDHHGLALLAARQFEANSARLVHVRQLLGRWRRLLGQQDLPQGSCGRPRALRRRSPQSEQTETHMASWSAPTHAARQQRG